MTDNIQIRDKYWPHDKESIEEAAFEVLNCKTIEYRAQWIEILIERVKTRSALQQSGR